MQLQLNSKTSQKIKGLRLPFLPIHHVVALGEKLPGDWKYLTRDYVQNLSVMIGGVFGLFSITLWYYSIPFKEMEFMNSPWYETKLNNMRGDGSLAEFSRKKRAKFYLDGELENEVEYGTHY